MIASAFPGAAKDFLRKNPHTCLSSCLLHCKNVIKQNKVRGGYFFPTQSAAKLPNLKLVNPRRLAFLVVIEEGDGEGADVQEVRVNEGHLEYQTPFRESSS